MTIERLSDSTSVETILRHAREQSDRQIEIMRAAAAEHLGDNKNIIVGVNGSVARREVTSGSDVDLFFLTVDGDFETAREIQSSYRTVLQKLHIKMPANGGVFDDPLAADDLLANIGGDNDTNKFLTRRMLYLLEGEWLHNQSGFDEVKTKLISHYVTNDIEDQKLCRYLLNDIIRYWRTICVDFEEKTADGNKPRAIRLIKLRFARMMLYFGGVTAICETGDISASEKRDMLAQMFAKPPIKRLVSVFGVEEIQPALTAYATFLNAIDDKTTRERLDQDGYSGLSTIEYRELVEVARDFRGHLQNLLVGPDTLRNPVASALLL